MKPLFIKIFICFSAFYLSFPITPGFAQSFTPSSGLPLDLDVGTNYTSCASPGTKQIDFTVPAGLPDMNTTDFGLKLIKLSFGECPAGSNYSMQIVAYLKSPSGTCVKVFDGITPNLSGTQAFGTTEVGMISGGLSNCLRPLNTFNFNYSLSSVNMTLGATGSGGYYSTSVFTPSTGVTFPINYVDSFKNASPAGIWSLYFFETASNAPCLTNAQLEFGAIAISGDSTALGDDCVNAIQYDGRPICVQTGGKDSSYNHPGWAGAPNALNIFSASFNCEWNGANNNDVWIKITPQTSGNTCINVSGLDANSQSIVVTDPNLDGDNKPCTGSPGGAYWQVVSCPQNPSASSTNDPIYGVTSGTRRPQNHCWNATAGKSYYLVVDGNGGVESPFYIYGSCNLPLLKITDPPTACAPATVDITSPLITTGSYLYGGSLSYFTDAAGTIPLSNPSAINTAGKYYIKASTEPGCPTVIKEVNVTFSSPPPLVLSSTPVCAPANPSIVSTTSQTGINYQLFNSSGGTVGAVKSGTGSSLTWTNVPPGSGYYVIGSAAGSSGCQSQSNPINVIQTSPITPTFNQLGPYCKDAIPASLPSTSTNTPTTFTGTWNPSVISTTTVGDQTYTFTPAAGQCATTATMTITVNQPPKPVVNCGQTTSNSVEFTWTNFTNASNYDISYTVNSGPSTSVPNLTASTYNISGLNQNDDVTIIVTPKNTSNPSFCFLSSDPKTCKSIVCPNPVITANPSPPGAIICEGSTTTLTATESGLTTPGTWTSASPAIATVGATGLVNGISAGKSVITFTPTNLPSGCSPKNIEVTVNPKPVPPVVTAPASICANTNALFTINGTPGLTVNYTLNGISGNKIVGSNGKVDVSVTNVTTNQVLVITDITNGICPNNITDIVTTINLNNPPLIPTITSTAPTCLASGRSTIDNYDNTLTYIFTPVGPSVGGSGLISGMTIGASYTVTAGNANCTSAASTSFSNASALSTPSTPTASVTVQPTCAAPTGTIGVTAPIGFTLEYSKDGSAYQASTTFTGLAPNTTYNITVRNTATGCVSNPRSLTIDPLSTTPPTPTLSVVSPTCAAPLTGSINVTAPLGFAYEYSINNIDYQVAPQFSSLVPNTYAVTVRDIATGCVSSATGTVQASPPVSSLPTPIAQPDYCVGDIPVAVSAAGTNLLWYTSPVGGVGSSTAPVPSTNSVGQRIFYVTQTTPPNGCESDRLPVIVKVNALPNVSAGPDKRIKSGESVILQGIATGNGVNIFWSPSATLLNANTVNPTARPLENTTYTIKVITQDGCKGTDSVLVVVLEPIDIPNVFSPNGDGIHDMWIIDKIEQYPNSVVEVFNRYGAKLLERKGYNKSNAWDGTNKGAPLPVGPYYYVIRLGDGSKVRAGVVSIVR